MHHLAPLIKDLAIILGVASLVTLLFQRIRQPIVLGYLVAGVIIGPYTQPYLLISDMSSIKILSELGVIFLMFSLGLEFSFHKLKRVGFTAGFTSLFEVLGMLTIGFITGKLIGWGFYDSLFLAAALAISSTTIIIKAFEDLRLKTQPFAEMVFGILIIEDILAILLLVALSIIVATNDIFSSAIAWATIKLILVICAWFLLGYFLILTFFRKIMQDVPHETLTIFSIALCLMLVWIADYFNYSTAIGAFVMGSILAETTIIIKIKELIQPIRDIFAAVFFVSVGMLINPLIIWDNLSIVFIICVITIVGKLLTTGIGAFLSGENLKDSLRIGFSMAQIGEFSFVIASLGLVLGVISDSIYPIIVAVSAITTFTTPYLIKLSSYVSIQADQHLPKSINLGLNKYTLFVNRFRDHSERSSFYRVATIRFIINGIIIAIIFNLIQYWALLEILKLVKIVWINEIICWFISILLCSPFIWMMLTVYNLNKNYLIMAICWAITLIEIILLSTIYFDTWLMGVLLLLMAAVFFTAFYKFLNKTYWWFEIQLIRNLYKKKWQ